MGKILMGSCIPFVVGIKKVHFLIDSYGRKRLGGTKFGMFQQMTKQCRRTRLLRTDQEHGRQACPLVAIALDLTASLRSLGASSIHGFAEARVTHRQMIGCGIKHRQSQLIVYNLAQCVFIQVVMRHRYRDPILRVVTIIMDHFKRRPSSPAWYELTCTKVPSVGLSTPQAHVLLIQRSVQLILHIQRNQADGKRASRTRKSAVRRNLE
mmetsp:Transcript_3098/g.5331  ORF Transcript_3098/g.5331 Transcript_3098/m.5331 type:complete len:209 (-) Transcript_3098:344-970(-)